MGDPDVKLVTVFRTHDIAAATFAKSILESEGIDYRIAGEVLRSVYGGWDIPSNIALAPAEIQVREVDAPRAIELLGQIDAL